MSTSVCETGLRTKVVSDVDDDTLRAWVADAELPSLIAALAYVLADESLLDDELRPPANQPLTAEIAPQGGLSEQAQANARELAVQGLRRLLDGEQSARPLDPLHVMQFLTDGADASNVPMLEHELGLRGDVAAPRWTKPAIAPDTDFGVAVIGAGMSGLAAAHRLSQAEVPFVVFEKNSEVGGTWLENRYPGCRLDTNNFAYSFSFAQKPDWTHQFSTRDDILQYFNDVAAKLDLYSHIRFGTEVVAASFDEATTTWEVRTVDAAGYHETHVVNAVITAVGQLNRPKLPDVPGIDTFGGTWFHSASWPEELDLRGRRVGVIGTGASAYQIVPAIAREVDALTVFQRTPPWMLPTPGYHDPLKPGFVRLLEIVPEYGRWFRFWQFWRSTEGRLPFVGVDENWDRPGTVSAANESLRKQLVERLRHQYATRPDLLAKMTPSYPPGGKRMLRDNGVWAEALQLPHVELVDTAIAEVTPRGVRTADGTERAFDVLVYATGFRASDFLLPMTVTGQGGTDLHEQWGGDAGAYMGVCVPEFPGLYMIYGPYMNLVVTGSEIFMSECAVEYVLECLRITLVGGGGVLNCKRSAYDAWNAEMDAGNRKRAWGTEGVTSWYKNNKGRVAQNWPFSLLSMYEHSRSVDVDSFEFVRPRDRR